MQVLCCLPCSLIQPRKINYEGPGLLFFCYHAPERWFDRNQKETGETETCEKNGSREITSSNPRRWQQKTEHPDIFFPTVASGLSCFLSPPLITLLSSSSWCSTSDSSAQVSITALTLAYLHLQTVSDTGSAALSSGMKPKSSLLQIRSHPTNMPLQRRVWMFNTCAFVSFQLRLIHN